MCKDKTAARFFAMNAMYVAWCKDEGLPVVSADEQDMETLTYDQKQVIDEFIEMWDEA